MSTTNPKHGDERNRREVTELGKNVEFIDQRNGATVYSGPASSETRTVAERYCAGCGKWIECSGVLGFLSFDFEHRDHGKEST